jgi:HlyD family secretion protein
MKTAEIFSRFKRQPWLIGIALILIMVAIYFVTQKMLGPKLLVHPVAVQNIVQTIVASGHVETPLRVDIASQITGTVASIPVAEGQTVKARQLLIALEDSEAKALVAQARAAVTQAEARLRQIRELGLPAARQALEQAKINRANVAKQTARTTELQAKGFVGQSALDDAQKNLAIADSQVKAAQLQVDSNEQRGSDYLLADAALQQAKASLEVAIARLDYTTIEAPVDGILIARNVERGDVVQPGKALMVLSPGGQVQLVTQIDERNLANLRLGEKAIAAADAFPDSKFAAEIAYINPAVDVLRGSVEVKLNVPAPPAHLRQDMTVSIDIEVARRSRTLVLSADAVHNGTGSEPWVMMVAQGHAKRQPVKLGLRGGGKVEILEGLQAGDEVIAAAPTTVAEGMRVRVLHVLEGSSKKGGVQNEKQKMP